MPEDTRNPAFAAYVEALAAGRSSRELSRVTRDSGYYVNATSIGDMRFGIVPGYKLLDRFVKGLELTDHEATELFARAGYSRAAPDDPSPESFDSAFGRLLREMGERLQAEGLSAPVPPMWHDLAKEGKTAEDAARIVDEIERHIRAEFGKAS